MVVPNAHQEGKAPFGQQSNHELPGSGGRPFAMNAATSAQDGGAFSPYKEEFRPKLDGGCQAASLARSPPITLRLLANFPPGHKAIRLYRGRGQRSP